MNLKPRIWMLALPLSLVMAFGTIPSFHPNAKAEEGIASTRDLMASMRISRVTEKIKAPVFGLKELGGKIVHLTDHRGKVVLINFWTTW